MPILQTTGLTKRFGGLLAVCDLDLDIRQGEIFGLVGPNGAGKSTVYNLITGVERPTAGDVFFEGQRITNKSVHSLARAGLIRTFQRSLPFGSMSVLDNVMVGAFAFGQSGFAWMKSRWFGLGSSEVEQREEASLALAQVGLAHMSERRANQLPYGDQRRLEIARALISRPKVLMLDEPAAGLSTEERDDLKHLLLRLREGGLTPVIIEHHLPLVLSMCDRVAVLNYGKKLAQGTPKEIRENAEVIEAYIGKSRQHA